MKELKNAFGSNDANDANADDLRSHDIRGWTLQDASGTDLGRMDDWMVDDEMGRVRYGIVSINGRRKLIPVGELSVDDDRRVVIARGYSMSRLDTMRDYDASTWGETTEREHYREHHPEFKGKVLDYDTDRFRRNLPKRIQLLEERLKLGKRPVKTGEVEIGKRPVTEPVSKDIELENERLDINRKAVNKPVEGRTTMGGKETINVSLYGEEPVVDKETFVKEEIEINKVKDRRTERVSDQVSHEELMTNDKATKREAAFAGTEPTESDLMARERYEKNRKLGDQVDSQVDITPIDDQSRIDRPL